MNKLDPYKYQTTKSTNCLHKLHIRLIKSERSLVLSLSRSHVALCLWLSCYKTSLNRQILHCRCWCCCLTLKMKVSFIHSLPFLFQLLCFGRFLLFYFAFPLPVFVFYFFVFLFIAAGYSFYWRKGKLFTCALTSICKQTWDKPKQ